LLVLASRCIVTGHPVGFQRRQPRSIELEWVDRGWKAPPTIYRSDRSRIYNMEKIPTIAVLGTFDSKAEEHIFLKERIEQKGLRTLTINVGTRMLSAVPVDLDLLETVRTNNPALPKGRDNIINAMLQEAKKHINKLRANGEVDGVISAGGGTGTHICTTIMHELPLGMPKVMVSTVASRDMSTVVGTKDITMIHSVADLLGVNSISGLILDKAAAAVCGMVQSQWNPPEERKRIALPFFGFITPGAEATRQALESQGYEVIAFHANGTGGMAMEELAAEIIKERKTIELEKRLSEEDSEESKSEEKESKEPKEQKSKEPKKESGKLKKGSEETKESEEELPNLNSMTKAELEAFAKDKKIEGVTQSLLKKEMISKIEDSL